MATRTIDDIDSALNYERESRLDRDESRENYRVATAPADQLERIALKCSAAFVKADDTAAIESTIADDCVVES